MGPSDPGILPGAVLGGLGLPVFAVLLADLADDATGVADGDRMGRDVLGHHRPGADDHIIADRHARTDDDVAAEPDVAADGDGQTAFHLGIAHLGVDRMIRGVQSVIGATSRKMQSMLA